MAHVTVILAATLVPEWNVTKRPGPGSIEPQGRYSRCRLWPASPLKESG
jgi:hypothetical protein